MLNPVIYCVWVEGGPPGSNGLAAVYNQGDDQGEAIAHAKVLAKVWRDKTGKKPFAGNHVYVMRVDLEDSSNQQRVFSLKRADELNKQLEDAALTVKQRVYKQFAERHKQLTAEMDAEVKRLMEAEIAAYAEIHE